MNTQEQAIARRNGQRRGGGSRNVRLRNAAVIAIIAAIAIVSTTVVMIGGPAPAHACLIFDYIC
ncbi:MAG: hypothetical protein OXO52_11695 [Rhodospirillales bacterium]|nr:hypothetical protein [Rhodospirillales bacterium]MDE0382193.1 hypothetical protein [Rhodospirillales bacterium]